MSDKEKFDVYEYKTTNGSSHLFSAGVSREFGENKVIYTEDGQLFASVQPLHDAGGLDLIGHCYR